MAGAYAASWWLAGCRYGRGARSCRSRSGGMACQAFRIVKGDVSPYLIMRIVTSYAADPPVGAAPASTFRKTIGLKANIDRGIVLGGDDIHRGAMTSAAKIDELRWIERSWIEDCAPALFKLIVLHRADVKSSRAMASLTGDSRSGTRRIEIAAQRGAGGVACKASLSCVCSLRLPKSADQKVLGRGIDVSGGQVQTAKRGKITELAFEKSDADSKNECLSQHSVSHGPEDLAAHRFTPTHNGVGAACAVTDNDGLERRRGVRDRRMGTQHVGF